MGDAKHTIVIVQVGNSKLWMGIRRSATSKAAVLRSFVVVGCGDGGCGLVWIWAGVGELLLHELHQAAWELRVASQQGRCCGWNCGSCPRLVFSLTMHHGYLARANPGDKLTSGCPSL